MSASDSLPRTARERARAEITRTIQSTARRHLAEVGPAALSLRAIAREVDMVSSAVYRYFPSRDDLLTALITEAYDEVGDAVEDADRAVAVRGDLAGRPAAICHAVRDWARAHPHEYALLYGSPVPGYRAPRTTVAPATRVPLTLLAIAEEMRTRSVRPAAPVLPVPDAEVRALAGIAEATGSQVDPAVLGRCLSVWATLVGHVSLELFGHLHRGVLDYDAHFAYLVDLLCADLGLRGAS